MTLPRSVVIVSFTTETARWPTDIRNPDESVHRMLTYSYLSPRIPTTRFIAGAIPVR